MKTIRKLLLIIAFVSGSAVISNAQEIGVRVGDVSGGSVAIDGIFSTTQFSRLHANISFGDGVGADLLWDFLYAPLPDEAFNWYVGVGPYLGVFDDSGDTDFELGAAFEIGIEYRFVNVPIALGLDYRPTLEIIDKTQFHWGGFGLNIRYVFGK